MWLLHMTTNTKQWAKYIKVIGSHVAELAVMAHFLSACAKLTNDPKDVFDGRNKYNKQVNQEDEHDCNEDMSGPVERFISEEGLKNGPANL